MKALLITAFLLFVFFYSCSQNEKILIVATNISTLGCNTSGTFLMEIAYPFQYFIDNGFDVDIVTPKGGKTAIYENWMMPDDLKKIKQSELFIYICSPTGNLEVKPSQ
ncbi:MAG: hypothetical protein K0S32_3602 [Bacteroidetes bacterium]|jgi:hypothetical protein|nr:hypothetical protein [Bacteroidota bacterium]